MNTYDAMEQVYKNAYREGMMKALTDLVGNKTMLGYKVIAVDFDGTLCESKWPEIGEANNALIYYLLEQQRDGAKLILNTCREGALLTKAVDWCMSRGLQFDKVNENLPEIIKKFGHGVDTRKISADEYIDDKMCTKFKLPYKASRNFFEPVTVMLTRLEQKDTTNYCVCCGEEIPEGNQVCNVCRAKYITKEY